MKRRDFMRAVSAGAAALAAPRESSGQTQEKRPNVLLLLPDEWRAQALGCMGNKDVRTPNIDRLAAEGVLFENTLANSPVCCPARATILTGTYASKNGMVANDLRLRESEITLGELFSQAGYRTGYIGKWHLDGGPREPGFIPPGPRRHGFGFWAANECRTNYYYSWYFRDANVPIITTTYEPEGWMDLAIEFLYQHQDSKQPFFLMVSSSAPHDPYVAPEDYLRRYDPASLTMRPNWVEGTRGAGRNDIAAYYAIITALDDQVGRLMKVMRELDLEENTIVLFTSDHGNMLGSHGKILKRKPWEESIRVPGVFRYPARIKPGRKTDALLSHVDFAPTLLSLCGIAVPRQMQGTDLSRVATGEESSGPEDAFFQIFGPYRAGGVKEGWRGIRTQRHMYARSQSGPWLLYDLQNDPYELHNQVQSAASIRDELNHRLESWMSRIGDSWDQDWTVPVEDAGRLYNYRTFYTVPEYVKWAKAHPNLAPGV